MKNIAATLLSFSVSFLPVTAIMIVVLLIVAAIVYLTFRIAPDGSRRSLIRFALGGLGVGVAAGFLGMGIGIAFFCSQSIGNLCGLGGVFLSGPLAFCLAVILYLRFWIRNGKTS